MAASRAGLSERCSNGEQCPAPRRRRSGQTTRRLLGTTQSPTTSVADQGNTAWLTCAARSEIVPCALRRQRRVRHHRASHSSGSARMNVGSRSASMLRDSAPGFGQRGGRRCGASSVRRGVTSRGCLAGRTAARPRCRPAERVEGRDAKVGDSRIAPAGEQPATNGKWLRANSLRNACTSRQTVPHCRRNLQRFGSPCRRAAFSVSPIVASMGNDSASGRLRGGFLKQLE